LAKEKEGEIILVLKSITLKIERNLF